MNIHTRTDLAMLIKGLLLDYNYSVYANHDGSFAPFDDVKTGDKDDHTLIVKMSNGQEFIIEVDDF